MIRNLAIARAGEDSKHETWLSDPSAKNFALLVAYYGDEPGKWWRNANVYDHTRGLKYPWFHGFLERNPWVFDYDAVWLCDDDIEADTLTVADMFDVFHERRLWIGQPSLTRGSVHSFPMFLCHSGQLLRYTEFIEEQMPIFSKEALHACRDTFAETQSGWGIGIAWPRIAGFPGDRLAVIDACPVAHRRLLKTGEMYTKVLPAMGLTAREELERMKAKYADFYHLGVVRGEIALDPSDPRTPGRIARQARP